METKTLEKVLDVAGNTAKIAANLSEAKKETPKPFSQTDDNSNKATTGSQTVVVSMDGKKKDQKPVEKHIHTFPEARALTNIECDVAMRKAQMDYELEKMKFEHTVEMDDREWKYNLERERKNEKKRRIHDIIAGIFGLCCVGGIGYAIYADSRDHKAMAPSTEPFQTEGTVK